MFKWLTGSARDQTAHQLYGSIVTRARSAEFYTRFAIADTVEGRFDVITLHQFVVLSALKNLGPDGQALSQQLVERFFEDLDDNMREMGIGDLTVPKKIRKFVDAFYGRSAAYAEAMTSGKQEALSIAIARNVYGADFQNMSEQEKQRCQALTTYIFKAHRQVAEWPLERFRTSDLDGLVTVAEATN